jgi:hypothetical protein
MKNETQSLSIRDLRGYLEASNSFYQSLLGYKPETVQLKCLDNSQWDAFRKEFNLREDSLGVYRLRNHFAVVPYQIETAPLSLFHEYFGHGLYCEQSTTGKRLTELENRLLQEEKQEFHHRQFTFKALQDFRNKNKTFHELKELDKANIANYESFAIFTEYLLSREFNLMQMFDRKYDSFSRQSKEGIDKIIGFNKQYGDLATFYEFGLARKTTPERVRRLLEQIYGKEAVTKSRLVLLSGSRKPFSDIDLFASSDFLKSAKNSWLDLIVFNEADFERRVRLFEVQVTHPILLGEFVAGDKNYLEQKRKQLAEQPITEEAIQHNLRESRESRLYSDIVEDPKFKEVLFSYYQTSLANALALKEGRRLLTKESLLSYSDREKFIELKGGIIE